MHPIAICPGCRHPFAYDFTAEGTDHYVPFIISDAELAEYLREGWHVTYHDHEGRKEVPDV